MGKIIVFTGNTGVGKTTLVHELSKLGIFSAGIEQHTERPFQLLFKQYHAYALANQIDYLLFRAEQESALRQSHQIGVIDGGLDQDFHAFTKLFYSRGMLSDQEFDLCQRLYIFLRSQLSEPDLIVHLTAPFDVIQKRLSTRDRINIADKNDLGLLDSYLEEWIFTLPKNKVIRLEVSDVSSSYSEVISTLINQINANLKSYSPTYDEDHL
ncbi:MAG: deoxynucleoside kinase [Chloroflexota bacterium]